MKDTFYFPPPEKYDRLASAYRLENGKLQRASRDPRRLQAIWKTWKFFNPAGACYSTVSDMFAFYQMVLNGGTYNGVRILSRAAVEAMTTVQTGDLPAAGGTRAPLGPVSRPGAGEGLGWIIRREPSAVTPLQSIGSYGKSGGLGTRGWIDPTRDLVVLFLIQRDGESAVGQDERSIFYNMAEAAIVD
jgi:CubicO group peptidase (beta-lactamase class C family)